MQPETMFQEPPSTTVIPHSRDAEEAVLGSVLINPDAYNVCAEFLTAPDFYIHRHRWIWEVFNALKIAQQPIDFLTVCDELDRRGKLSEIGGPAYLTALLNQVPTSLHAEAYARQVKQTAIRRSMLTVANQMATLAYNETEQTDNVLVEIQRQLSSLMAISTGHQISNLAPVLRTVYDNIEERSKNPTDVWGIKTGFPKLDKETGGQHLGEMTIIAAEPGFGKTWLCLGFAYEMAKTVPGAFFSLEMQDKSIARRLISGVGRVNSRNMRTGRMQEDDWNKLVATISELETLPFYLDGRARDTAGLRSSLLRLKREQGIQWFILDYMQLLTDEGKDDNERTKKIGRELKLICVDLELAGIVINSVNKQGMDKSGREARAKSNMSGSGQTIHDADNIFLLTDFDTDNNIYTPEQKARMATLWCMKGREYDSPKFFIHLARREYSPFWGEMAQRGKL
jgi:replicative DNA helicase